DPRRRGRDRADARTGHRARGRDLAAHGERPPGADPGAAGDCAQRLVAQAERAPSLDRGGGGVDALPPVRVASSNRWRHVLAAAVYRGVSLWVHRAVLPAPARDLPYAGFLEGAIREVDHSDELAMVALVSRNTRVLGARPWTLFEGGQCHPLKRP